MPLPPQLPCFSILILLLCFSSFVISNELNALLTLKSSLHPSNPNLFSSWIPSNPTCSFHGISCDSNGSIIEIDLSNNLLSGTLPFDSICSLSSLQKLAFGFNSLSGNITPHLTNCTNLQYLDLGNNQFTGSFPDISPLTKLKYLYLNSSSFGGTFPWDSLSNLTGLIHLSVGDNPFEITPFPKQIIELKNLNLLYLTNSSISGSIPPEIGNLVELNHLELSCNYLSNSIPPEISNLRNLRILEFHDNNLNGELPIGFGKLINLEYLDGSNNSLVGNLSELRYLNQLVSLQMFQNNFSGEIPSEFGEFKKLVNLSLYTNNLTGELPKKLGSWAKFNFIDVSTNSLSGSIPPDMCKMGTMQKLLILENKFSGEIPVSYGNCSTLTRFRVNQNSLTGSVPDGIWGFPNLNIIDISDNLLKGTISSNIGKAKSLGQIHGWNNRLSGSLPVEISRVSSLVSIDLSYNKLVGEIPENVGDLKKLNDLHLEGNQLSGEIPVSLGDCSRLSELNLAKNSLSGDIPISLGSLPVLNSLNLSHNVLSGRIPNTLTSLTLSLVDLSYNELSGPIPDSLIIEGYNESFVGNPSLCSSKIKHFRPCSSNSRHTHTLVTCLVVGLAIIIILSGVYLYFKIGATQKDESRSLSLKDDYSWNMKSYHVLTFSEGEILDGIKPQNLIGKGGCGSVYKITLKDGMELAVKHIWNVDSSYDPNMIRSSTPMLDRHGGRSRKSKEFDMEVQTLSSIRHINVVKLYCSITSDDSSSNLLVYEYMPNGSLWDRLHGTMKSPLNWQARYEIALGAAKGLEYLHHGYDRPIIHRDVKSSNILLDKFLKPRIADFGLAKIIQVDASREFTQVITGTLGYIAPEYGYTHKVNEKSDVYSFGVVLMELVTGKRPMETEFGDNTDIVSWVSSKLKSKETVLSLIDSSIEEPLKEEVISILKIAIRCTVRFPELRPTMRNVVQMLEEVEPHRMNIIVDKDDSKKIDKNKESF